LVALLFQPTLGLRAVTLGTMPIPHSDSCGISPSVHAKTSAQAAVRERTKSSSTFAGWEEWVVALISRPVVARNVRHLDHDVSRFRVRSSIH
jgi:hypothetical protein